MYPPSLLIHTATLHHNNGNKQTLTFSAPTGTATAGQTVTGTTSHATAVIDAVASPMVVKTVSGTFVPGETISTATWSATLTSQDEYFDGNGLTVPDVSSTTVSCRYSPKETRFVNNVLVVVSARVVLPPASSPSLGDAIDITTEKFTETFVLSADPKPTFEVAQDIVSHWTCEIAKAGATGATS